MNNVEEWRAVSDTDGFYEVSNLGRVRNGKTGHILSPKHLPNGYLRVKVSSNDRKRDRYVHRLVAEAFCYHPEGKDVVNHLDNDTINNAASNLEWCTTRDNVNYAMIQARVKNFPNSIVIEAKKQGMTYIFRSLHEAAETIGCCHKTLKKYLLSGKTINGYSVGLI